MDSEVLWYIGDAWYFVVVGVGGDGVTFVVPEEFFHGAPSCALDVGALDLPFVDVGVKGGAGVVEDVGA